MANSGWIVVSTQTQKESAVSRHLEAESLRVLFPRYTNLRNVPYALFPGYIFVYVRDPDDYDLVKRTPGVLSVLRSASGPEDLCVCPAWIIWSIESRMDDEGFVSLDQELGGSAEPEVYESGDQLLVKHGVLAGKLVEFVKLDGLGRVAALYNAFERTASVTLDRRDVQAV